MSKKGLMILLALKYAHYFENNLMTTFRENISMATGKIFITVTSEFR